MLEWFQTTFSIVGFMPHGHCFLWKPTLLGIHVFSDTAIFLSYSSIPISLVAFVRKREDLPFGWIFMMFGAFILACGLTHLFGVISMWYPTYWVSGFIKFFAAIISIITAIALIPLLPKALAIPSPAMLREANQELAIQMVERHRIELELKENNAKLEESLQMIRLLQEVAIAANEANTVDEVIQVSLDKVCLLTGWPVGHAYVLSQNGTNLLNPTGIFHLDSPERFLKFKEITQKTSFAPGKGLPGRVLASGKPAWIMDVYQDPNFPRREAAQDIEVVAEFGFPVVFNGHVNAVLEFFSSETLEPDQKLLDVMESIGDQLGEMIERKGIEKKLETSNHEIIHINQVVQTVNSTLNLDEVMQFVMKALQEVFEFDVIGVQLIDAEKQLLCPYKMYGEMILPEDVEQYNKITIPLNGKSSILNAVVSLNQYIYLPRA